MAFDPHAVRIRSTTRNPEMTANQGRCSKSSPRETGMVVLLAFSLCPQATVIVAPSRRMSTSIENSNCGVWFRFLGRRTRGYRLYPASIEEIGIPRVLPQLFEQELDPTYWPHSIKMRRSTYIRATARRTSLPCKFRACRQEHAQDRKPPRTENMGFLH